MLRVLSRRLTSGITRIGTEDPRMSRIVIHNNTVFLSGQTAAAEDGIEAQSKAVLEQTEALLQRAGVTKSNLVTASIWLKDIKRDFKAFNEVWNGWIDPENKPVRATVEAPMARESILVEVQVTAAAAAD